MDKKQLNKLIEQVLMEKGWPYDMETTRAPQQKKDLFGKSDWPKVTDPNDGKPRTAGSTLVKGLAGLGVGKNSELEDADLDAAYDDLANPNIYDAIVDAIAAATGNDPDVSAAAKKAKTAADQRRATDDAKAKAAAVKAKAELDATDDDYTKRGATTNPGVQTTDRYDRLEPFGTPAASYADVDAPSITDLQGKQLKNLDSVKIDSSVARGIEGIPGKTFLEKLNSIIENVNKLENSSNNQLTNKQVAQMANSIKYANLLAKAAQEYESSSAGTAFETWVALLQQGIVVGGESGAVDTIEADGTYSSSKFLSSSDMKQALQKSSKNNIGIEGVVTKGFRDIVYIVGMKRATKLSEVDYSKAVAGGGGKGFRNQASDFTADAGKIKFIDIIALRISRGQMPGQFKAKAITSAGEVDLVDPYVKGEDLIMGSSLVNAYSKNAVYASIPVLPDASGIARNATEMLNQKVNKFGNFLLGVVAEIYRKIKNIDTNTQEYIGIKGKDKADNIDKQVDTIVSDYGALKSLFQGVFDTFEGKGAVTVEESKTSLDKLIEAIVKEKLSK